MTTTLLRRLAAATAALLAFTAMPALAQLSVDVTGDIDSNLKIAVPALPAQQDKEYWIGLPNFYSVMSYNPRIYYAMTVSRLAAAMSAEAAKLDPDMQ